MSVDVAVVFAGALLALAGLSLSPFPWLALVVAGAALVYVGLTVDFSEGGGE